MRMSLSRASVLAHRVTPKIRLYLDNLAVQEVASRMASHQRNLPSFDPPQFSVKMRTELARLEPSHNAMALQEWRRDNSSSARPSHLSHDTFASDGGYEDEENDQYEDENFDHQPQQLHGGSTSDMSSADAMPLPPLPTSPALKHVSAAAPRPRRYSTANVSPRIEVTPPASASTFTSSSVSQSPQLRAPARRRMTLATSNVLAKDLGHTRGDALVNLEQSLSQLELAHERVVAEVAQVEQLQEAVHEKMKHVLEDVNQVQREVNRSDAREVRPLRC